MDVEAQDTLTSPVDHDTNQQQLGLQIEDMPTAEMEDITPPVEDHLLEQPVEPAEEPQNNTRPSEAKKGPQKQLFLLLHTKVN